MSSLAYNPATVAGSLFDQGARSLTEIGNKYANNEAIGGLVAGTFIDAARTQMNAGTSLQYNQAMSSHLMNLQSGFENLRTGNQLKLMGAEGRIAKDLIGAQGAQQRLNIGAQGTQDRLNIAATGTEQRKGLRVAGQEERLNIGKRYSEERRMRADARGAISSLGARFYG